MLHHETHQHAPICASLVWERAGEERAYQEGQVLVAANRRSADRGSPSGQRIEKGPAELWDSARQSMRYQNGGEPSWAAINSYAVDVLVRAGAKSSKATLCPTNLALDNEGMAMPPRRRVMFSIIAPCKSWGT